MSINRARVDDYRSQRTWIALLILVAGFFLQDPVETLVYHPFAHAAGLHMIQAGAMAPVPYGVLMVFRLLWNLAIVGAICAALGRPVVGFPMVGPRSPRLFIIGLAIGLFVMVAAIGAIVLSRNATVLSSGQSLASAVANGAAWLGFDILGATGEELAGRVALLLVMERLVGWKGAIIVSGLMFSVLHLWNPGASPIWIVRLGVQGMLLAYAVYRTRSMWWSVGYHAGWNWASAPLFGAAGSGYLDRGHIFDFTATGPDLITGGIVGPEGSVFACAAVVVAFALLLWLTPRSAGETGGDDAGGDRELRQRSSR